MGSHFHQYRKVEGSRADPRISSLSRQGDGHAAISNTASGSGSVERMDKAFVNTYVELRRVWGELYTQIG